VPVRVSSPNPFFFEQVVAAFARADSMFEPMEDFAQLGLAEGMSPETEVAVVFAPAGESPFWSEIGDELPPGAPEVVVEGHPLVARIDPALLTFEGARRLTAPAGAVVVLAHPDGTPLLYQARADGRTAVVMNLDPGRGGFFLSPWFPVLVHDATALLTGREEDFPSAVATGGTVAVPGTGAVEEASLDGRAVEAGPRMAAARRGNYEVSRSGTRWWFGGAVLSPGESGKGADTAKATAVVPAGGLPLAMWLLAAALVAVAVEEILYHRRKVG